MTELTFLIELLLNHKLPKPTKDAISARIKEVESQLGKPTYAPAYPVPTPIRPAKDPTAQAPSTQALLDKEAGIYKIEDKMTNREDER